jgi:dihydroorotase
MEDLVIKGKILLGGKPVEGSIGIQDGKINQIKKGNLKGEREITLKKNQILLPGLIDVHTHLRDFQQKNKETVESGTKAAVHGGITAVFDMPNTDPPVMDLKTFRMRTVLFEGKSYSDFAVGFLVSNNCGEAEKVKADFYKIFMGASTGGVHSRDFSRDYSCTPGILSVHAEDPDIIRERPDRPPEAEMKAVEKILKEAEVKRKPLNICHVSTKGALEIILAKNLPWISFEVTPHHLFLTENDYRNNPMLKVYPPLRSREDERTLWNNFSKIPIIASDHAPHTVEDKEAGAAGIPGLETEVGLLLNAVNMGMIELGDIVEKMHINPVKVFGIVGKGLHSGADADFTIVDMKKEWVVKPEEFYTKAKWSPWEGKKLKGKVVMTILHGEVVMEDDEIIGKPRGVRLNVRRYRNKRGLESC